MPQTEQTESKYAKKRAMRKASGLKEFRGLGEGQHAAEWNPMPRPMMFDYYPKNGYGVKQGIGDLSPMKHEDSRMVVRLRNKDFVYPKPRWKNVPKVVKYDHYRMNYSGGPTDNPNVRVG